MVRQQPRNHQAEVKQQRVQEQQLVVTQPPAPKAEPKKVVQARQPASINHRKTAAELEKIYNGFATLHNELDKKSSVFMEKAMKNRNTVSLQQRKAWGQWSHGWSQRLRKLRSDPRLKNDGFLNIHTVTDKAKNSMEFYGSNLHLAWSLMNDRMSGKQLKQQDLDLVNTDVEKATKDSTAAIKLLKSGVDDIAKLKDN